MLTAKPADDAGMTLAELLVGMGLLLIVATLTTTFFVGQSKQTGRTIDASFATAGGRTTLTQIASALRLADTPTAEPGYPTGRFLTASPTQLVFFSNIAPNRSGSSERTPPTKIDIHISGSSLVEQDYAPIHVYTTYPQNYDSTYTANYPTTPTVTNVLLSSLTNTSSVFTFCAPPTTSSTCPALPTDAHGAVVAASLGDVAAVTTTLVLPDPAGKNPQTFQTTVSITGAFT
jgi:type II secretory pathway pseudopilin PulG